MEMRKQTKQSHKRLMLSLLAVLGSVSLMAQNIKVHGVVKDQTGEAVIGATVKQQGTGTGTVTDFDGNFTLDVPANATLSISYIGFTPQTIAVSGQKELSIAT